MPELTGTVATPNLFHESSRYELTLGDYWRMLIKRKYIVLMTFISVLAGTIAYTNAQTPIYRADAAVRISQSASAFSMDPSMFYGGGGSDPMAIHESSITSQKVLERVVIRLGLLEPEAKADDLINKVEEIRGAISTKVMGSTDIIQISVHYEDPELCAALANQIAEVFSEINLLDKTKQARHLRQFVEGQLKLFDEKLKSTEEKISDFRQSGRALGIAIGLENRLSELERERDGLLKLYTEKHPDVAKTDEMIQAVREKIRGLPSNELELARLQRDLEISDRAYRTMKEKYESARLSEAETVGDATVVETATVPTVPISPKKNLNKLLGAAIGLILGVVLSFGVESIDTSIGTIEDVERTIRLPVIGIVPYFDPLTHDYPWWRLDKIMAAIIHRRINPVPSSASLIMNQDSLSTLSESYRILRTFTEFILEKQATQGGKIIVITSTGSQEGKSLTTANLAISLAQAGKKTLLIDADLRRPVVHRLFGLKRAPGLSEILLNMAEFKDVKCTMGDILLGESSQWDKVISTKMLDRLEIVTTGTTTHNPAELIASVTMKKLLDEVKKNYEYVLLDTPPVLPVTDARTLGMLADVTFFIYRAGKTARRALIRAKDELDLAGVHVKGIILNHATAESQLTNSYSYQYYGEDKNKKKKVQRL